MMNAPSPGYSPYQSQRDPQSFVPGSAPPPPPKPSSQEVSRRGTPACPQPFGPPQEHLSSSEAPVVSEQTQNRETAQIQPSQDPGDRWLPKILEDKTKQDLAQILASPDLLAALTHASSTAHPSIAASQEPLQAALKENVALASFLTKLEARLTHTRASTQTQLLSTHALERQWRQKQSEMDRALAPFSPSSLYQRLSQGVQEQEMVCRALEESFLEGDGGTATEKEVTEWVRRYREAKKVYYLRQERKERWDEGRVGGWR